MCSKFFNFTFQIKKNQHNRHDAAGRVTFLTARELSHTNPACISDKMSGESTRWLPRAVAVFLVISSVDPCFTNEYGPPWPADQCSCRRHLSARPTGYAERCGRAMGWLRLRGGTGRQRKSTAVSEIVYPPFTARVLFLRSF